MVLGCCWCAVVARVCCEGGDPLAWTVVHGTACGVAGCPRFEFPVVFCARRIIGIGPARAAIVRLGIEPPLQH